MDLKNWQSIVAPGVKEEVFISERFQKFLSKLFVWNLFLFFAQNLNNQKSRESNKKTSKTNPVRNERLGRTDFWANRFCKQQILRYFWGDYARWDYAICPKEENLLWNLILYIYQFFKTYKVKLHTSISSFTVDKTHKTPGMKLATRILQLLGEPSITSPYLSLGFCFEREKWLWLQKSWQHMVMCFFVCLFICFVSLQLSFAVQMRLFPTDLLRETQTSRSIPASFTSATLGSISMAMKIAHAKRAVRSQLPNPSAVLSSVQIWHSSTTEGQSDPVTLSTIPWHSLATEDTSAWELSPAHVKPMEAGQPICPHAKVRKPSYQLS